MVISLLLLTKPTKEHFGMDVTSYLVYTEL